MKSVFGRRRRRIGQIGIARGKSSRIKDELAAFGCFEPARAAKLLVNAQAVAGCALDIRVMPPDLIGRGMHFDDGRAADSQRGYRAAERQALILGEIGGDTEDVLGAQFAPIIETILLRQIVGRPDRRGEPPASVRHSSAVGSRWTLLHAPLPPDPTGARTVAATADGSLVPRSIR